MKKPKIIITDNREEYYRKRRELFLAQVARPQSNTRSDIAPKKRPAWCKHNRPLLKLTKLATKKYSEL